MIVYLSSFSHYFFENTIQDKDWNRLNGLLSFALLNEKSIALIPKTKRFILDSGAFTFINKKMKNKRQNGEVNWDEYIDSYCNFIVEKDIKNFFEMDVDFLVGYDKVREFRRKITKKTGKLPIPVWHVSRGRKDFCDMCDEFPYVAVGGIVLQETSQPVTLDMMKWLIDEAHSRGAIIHGLGFTNTNLFPEIHFDSVDSSSFIQNSCYGTMCYIQNGKLKSQYLDKSQGVPQRDYFCSNLHTWLDYCEYAESHY